MIKLLGVWGLLVASGFSVLIHYSTTPGDGDRGALHWPRDSRIERAAGLPALLIFLHPECPCSRAAVEELSRLLARAPRRMDVTAVFVRPVALEAGWEQKDLWASATRLPGVRVVCDPGGAEARRFGAATSGFTLLFDVDGALVFCGGITGSRGHQGDNAGEDAILAWLSDGQANPAATPVFGCPLLDE